MQPIDPQSKLAIQNLQETPRQQETVREEVRRFGDFDEITETLEVLQNVGGQVEQVDIKQLVFRIAQNPAEAEAAQANLDPERVRKVIAD